MQVCTSLQTDNHASTPPLCFLQAGCPSCRPTNSVKALKAQALKAQLHTHSYIPIFVHSHSFPFPFASWSLIVIPMGFPFPLGILNCNIELEFANKNFNQSISQIYLQQISIKQKETQRTERIRPQKHKGSIKLH